MASLEGVLSTQSEREEGAEAAAAAVDVELGNLRDLEARLAAGAARYP